MNVKLVDRRPRKPGACVAAQAGPTDASGNGAPANAKSAPGTGTSRGASGRVDRLILSGFLSSFAFLLLAKLIGAGKEVVVAHAYGTSLAVDAYALGFALANWPATLGAMCANSILIPIFVASIRDPENGALDVRGLLIRLFPVLIVVSAAVFVLLRFGGALLSLSPEMAAALSVQALGLALMIPPGIAAAVLAAKLMSSRRQISSLLEAIPALFVCGSILAFGSALPAGPLLAWATGVGMLFYFGALIQADRDALRPGAARPLRLEKFKRRLALVLVAQVVFSIGGVLLDQVAAAVLPMEQNAVVGYANRILMLATGLGATAIGRAVLPVLSDAWIKGTHEGRGVLYRWFGILFAAGLAAALVGYPFAPFAVRILFEHGSFTAGDTVAVSSLVRVGLLQLPFYFSSLILAQGAVVQMRFGWLLAGNLLGVLIKLLIVATLLREHGVNVLMYGTATMYFVSLVVLGCAQIIERGKTCRSTS